ncbi:MAG: FKBP-type peptidyl-prolyl cis-trans isomerase [candidate division Zixibacteria bacterium]|nr:FKBP-type peptidyl-prolyl cis-trans isomerase [candidate division Zixibacteria bacterium]
MFSRVLVLFMMLAAGIANGAIPTDSAKNVSAKIEQTTTGSIDSSQGKSLKIESSQVIAVEAQSDSSKIDSLKSAGVKGGTKKGSKKEITTKTGLKYIDIKVGQGASPKKGDTVQVHYTGWLLNGRKFDSSVDRNLPFEFRIGMGEVISGWDEGVMTMKVGGKRKLIIPPILAYGNKNVGGIIPPNSTLVFEVELLGIK